MFEQEADEAREAAAINHARGPEYEPWAKFWRDRAERYEKWARGRAGTELVTVRENERLHRRALVATKRPD
ncbi:MAG TPA: hypothetical protein VFV84_04725 [Burkholderiales bacterium]|nr:hypothetical protein [Burkholderiales bacterium]